MGFFSFFFGCEPEIEGIRKALYAYSSNTFSEIVNGVQLNNFKERNKYELREQSENYL